MTSDSAAPTISDEELSKILEERDEQERKDADQAACDLTEESACPVCSSPLHIVETKPLLKPFLGRRRLRCDECGLRTPASPSFVGWGLAMILAVSLALGGMSLIFKAQRITETGDQKIAFVVGALLFVAGLFTGYGVHGAGNRKHVSQRILEQRRRHQQIKREKKDGKRRKEDGEEQGKDDAASFFQENLEAIIVAIILALIIRHFAMEAFVIPTGSMAPTLLGDHFRVTCTNCSYPFEISKSEGQFASSSEASRDCVCPVCETDFSTTVTRGGVFGGHKILVNKFVYKTRAPRRYEIIVFKYPRDPSRNYIKRLVGLPGEQLQIINGDLHADGKLARKPDHVQDAVWIPVHDASYKRREGLPWWLPMAKGGEEPREVWDFDADGTRIICKPGLSKDAPLTWLAYQRETERGKHGIRDVCSYNRSPLQEDNPVADLRVRVRVTPQAGAIVRLAVMETNTDDEGKTFKRLVVGRFEAGTGTKTMGLEVNGRDGQLALQKPVQLPALAPGVPVELTLAYADDRARMQIDGETVLTWLDTNAPSRTASSNVRLGVEGADATLEDVRIDRDIFYVRGSGGTRFDPAVEPVVVPKDSFFCMGDNSPNSADGREWGFVHQGNLIGRAFVVFWPILPYELQFIR